MRVGIIGCGAISAVHADAIKKSGQELVALCDVDAAAADALNRRHKSQAAVYTDYKTMLKCERLNAVHICTPHFLHAEMAQEALKRGVNTLVEKPLAIQLSDAAHLQESAKGSGVQMGVCLQNRYLDANMRAHEILTAQNILHAGLHVVWSRDKRYYSSADWRGKLATEGGGVLINQALHTLDLLIWNMGMPKFVTASTQNFHLQGDIEVEDSAMGYLEFCDTRSAVFFATTAGGEDNPPELTFRGDRSLVELSGDRLKVDGIEVAASRSADKQLVAAETKPCWGTGHNRLIADFYDCLASGRHFPIDAAEGAKSVQLILAVYRSYGKRIAVHCV